MDRHCHRSTNLFHQRKRKCDVRKEFRCRFDCSHQSLLFANQLFAAHQVIMENPSINNPIREQNSWFQEQGCCFHLLGSVEWTMWKWNSAQPSTQRCLHQVNFRLYNIGDGHKFWRPRSIHQVQSAFDLIQPRQSTIQVVLNNFQMDRKDNVGRSTQYQNLKCFPHKCDRLCRTATRSPLFLLTPCKEVHLLQLHDHRWF